MDLDELIAVADALVRYRRGIPFSQFAETVRQRKGWSRCEAVWPRRCRS